MDAILTIKEELKNNPEGLAYDLDNAALTLSLLNERNRTKIVPYKITELGIYNTFGDPMAAETFLQKMEAIAEQNPVVKRMFRWIGPGSDGLDVGNPMVRAALDSLVGTAGITQEEVNHLKDDAERQISRAEEIGAVDIGEDLYLGHVNQAITILRNEETLINLNG